jgi:hypothetical protein
MYVTLRAGSIDKTLVVVGDRSFHRTPHGVVPAAPAPFVEMPIVYERTFGGTDPQHGAMHREPHNPVGVGFALQPEALVGTAAPNIAYPSAARTPAGLGAIAPNWQPRLALAGTYDATWREERMPLCPLDFDVHYFHAAPEDQRVPGYLREGTPIEVLGMTPEGALRFKLPKVRPCFRTVFGRELVEWHTALPCHGREHRLDRTVVWEKIYV